MLDPDMHTNQSKYTVSFGGVETSYSTPNANPTAYVGSESEEAEAAEGGDKSDKTDIFPTAAEVGAYLRRLKRELERESEEDENLVFRLGRDNGGDVVHVDQIGLTAIHEVNQPGMPWRNLAGKFKITVKLGSTSEPHQVFEGPGIHINKDSVYETLIFDHVVIASGYFGKSKFPHTIPLLTPEPWLQKPPMETWYSGIAIPLDPPTSALRPHYCTPAPHTCHERHPAPPSTSADHRREIYNIFRNGLTYADQEKLAYAWPDAYEEWNDGPGLEELAEREPRMTQRLLMERKLPRIIHSSQFRVMNLFKSLANGGARRKILVVGGSMSGAEVASAIATKLSAEASDPETTERIRKLIGWSALEVHHVASRPFWTLPRFVPVDGEGTAPLFVPIDFALFNLAKRSVESFGDNRAGIVDKQAAGKTNAHLSRLSGQPRPHAWSEELGDKVTDSFLLGICDDYTTLAKSGNIITHRGRVTDLKIVAGGIGEAPTLSATVAPPPFREGATFAPNAEATKALDDVVLIIMATGFEPGLGFLSERLKAMLGYELDSYLPLNLAWQSTICPTIMNMGFVGTYPGPFWAIMEQQAALLRDLWIEGFGMDVREVGLLPLHKKVREAEAVGMQHLERIDELRRLAKSNPERISQFPMGDYVFVMNELLALRGGKLEDALGTAKLFGGKQYGIICSPLLPLPPNFDQVVINAKVHEAQDVVQAGLYGKFFPRNVFRALCGKWKLNRTIVSKHPSWPSGTLIGTAVFHPRTPTCKKCTAEYLFHEEGDYIATTGPMKGMVMQANRRYVYRLASEPVQSGKEDKISVWFVKTSGEGKNVAVDNLFHELAIQPPLRLSASAVGVSTAPDSTSAPAASNLGGPSQPLQLADEVAAVGLNHDQTTTFAQGRQLYDIACQHLGPAAYQSSEPVSTAVVQEEVVDGNLARGNAGNGLDNPPYVRRTMTVMTVSREPIPTDHVPDLPGVDVGVPGGIREHPRAPENLRKDRLPMQVGWREGSRSVCADAPIAEETAREVSGAREYGLEGPDFREYWTASAHHLCVQDHYEPEYEFQFKGAELERWSVGYSVRGPGKDYYILNVFSRPWATTPKEG